jgi:dolichol kinase
VTDSFVYAESQRIAHELYALLQSIDPVRWRAGVETVARERIQRLRVAVRNLLDSQAFQQADATARQLQERLRTVSRLLDELAPKGDMAAEVQRFRARMQPAYAAMAAWLQEHAVDVPTLRPTNWSRSVFHVATGLALFASVQYVMTSSQQLVASLVFMGVAWSLEILRKDRPKLNAWLMRGFGPVAHHHEHHRINSATWYGTAMFLMALFGAPRENCIGILVLAFADPTAAYFGRRFGRIRLAATRSLEGTLAFFVAGALVTAAYLAIHHPLVSGGAIVAVSALAALFGALAELVSTRLDDNFTIPISATLGASLAFFWCGA